MCRIENMMPNCPPEVARRYRIESLLGQGGMGAVYRAYDMRLDRKVAIKFLRQNLAEDKMLRRRFVREAQAMAKVEHPNIVKIYAVEDKCKSPYLVEEFVEGDDLDKVVALGGPFDEDKSKEVFIQIVAAVAELHKKKLIHRDIKPMNVLIDRDNNPLLLDFGLILDKNRTALTEDGAVIGTVYYMPPEVLMGSKSTNASDVFQLGLLLNFIITGEMLLVPTKSDGHPDLSSLFLPDREIPEPDELIPSPIREVISRCCQKDPSDRFNSAIQLHRYLERKWYGRLSSPEFDVSIKVSSIDRDVVGEEKQEAQKSKIRSIHFILMALLILVLVIASSFGSREYAVEKLNVRVGASSAQVTFSSDFAFNAKVTVKGPNGTMSECNSSISTTNHQFCFGKLTPKRKYELVIVFPNGKRSLPRVVRTKGADWTLSEVKVMSDGVSVSGQCSFANATGSLEFITVDGGQRKQKFITDSEGVYSVDFTTLPNDAKELVWEYKGGETTVSGKFSRIFTHHLRGIETQGRQLQSVLEQITRGGLTNRMLSDFNKRARNEKLKKGRGEKSDLTALVIRYFDELSKTANLTLGTEICSMAQRKQIVLGLNTLQLVHLCAEKGKPGAGFSKIPNRGIFSLSSKPLVKAGDSKTIFKEKFVAVPMLRSGKEWGFDLPRLDSIKRAELRLECKPYSNQAAQLRVNELKLLLYDRPHIPTVPSRAKTVVRYHPLPKWALKRKGNVLHIKPLWLGSSYTMTSRIVIESAEIVVEYE